MPAAIRVNVSLERLQELPADVFLAVESGERIITSMHTFVAHFMTDEDGDYLEHEDAAALLRESRISVLALAELAQRVQQDVSELVAPKASAPPSTS